MVIWIRGRREALVVLKAITQGSAKDLTDNTSPSLGRKITVISNFTFCLL
jgi:hypothetical protein